jgi:aryl-alcohol dehydrogenase-like predicted oxidoreductase
VRRAIDAGVTFFYADTYDDGASEETMEALDDVVRASSARTTSWCPAYAWQFAKAQHIAATRFVSMQNRYKRSSPVMR